MFKEKKNLHNIMYQFCPCSNFLKEEMWKKQNKTYLQHILGMSIQWQQNKKFSLFLLYPEKLLKITISF